MTAKSKKPEYRAGKANLKKVFAAADEARTRVSAMSREERAELEARGRKAIRAGRSNRKTAR